MTTHLDIPPEFDRNEASIRKIGVEKTGKTLIELACDRMGFPDLSDKDVLDVGCGVRFTQTIINCGIPIRSYTGIDIDEPLITYLSEHIKDARFSFHYWHIHNEMFNPKGNRLSKRTKLPLPHDSQYDVIWLFSVFTHLNPTDAESLLYLLRSRIAVDGRLFFSAFIDNNIASFEDRIKEHPLLNAYYSEDFMTRILSRTGWQVHSTYERDPENYIMNSFVCSPKPTSWHMFKAGKLGSLASFLRK